MPHPTLLAVNTLLDELGTFPPLRPKIACALEQLRCDFPDDKSIAAGVMMVSEKVDLLMESYTSFLAHHALGETNALSRQCAFMSEFVFTLSPTPSRLEVRVGADAVQLVLRKPTKAGGCARLEQPGYHSEPIEAVFRAASFTPRGELRLRGNLSVANFVPITRDELYALLFGLCTAPGVTFTLVAGRASLVRSAGGVSLRRACVTRASP